MSDENQTKPSEGTPEDIKKEAEALEASLLLKIRDILKEELAKAEKKEEKQEDVEKAGIKDKEPEKKEAPKEKDTVIKGFAGEQPPIGEKTPEGLEEDTGEFFTKMFTTAHGVKKLHRFQGEF